MSQDSSLDLSLAFPPFQLNGATAYGEAKGTTGPGGEEMGQRCRAWTRDKCPAPCLCFAHSIPDVCGSHTRIQETRALRSQECQGNGGTEKETVSD